MKAVKLLKEAAHLLETPGDFNEEDRKNTINDIGLFLSDQERRAADTQAGVRVSTDGENWEYTDKVHVVSRVAQAGRDDMKEFSMTMTAGHLDMEMKSTIESDSACSISIDYEALTTFGIEGVMFTEAGSPNTRSKY